jgi:hypothetical protein
MTPHGHVSAASSLLPRLQPSSSGQRFQHLNSDEARHAKRKKIATACEPCRIRKGRCDGERPVCGRCRQRPPNQEAETCVYRHAIDHSSAKRRRTRNVVPSISVRGDPLQSTELEATNTTHIGSMSQSASSVSVDTPPQHLPAADHNHNPAPHQLDISQPMNNVGIAEWRNEQMPSPRNSDHDTAVTAMGATADSRSSQPGTPAAYYGESSAVHFLKEFHHSFGGAPQAQPGMQLHSPSPSQRIRQSSTGDLGHMDIVLPSRRTADYLMGIYWSKSYSLYPFLDRHSIERAYRSLWSGESAHQEVNKDLDLGSGSFGDSGALSRIFHCALNAIFALSCQLAGPELPRSERDALAERFFVRAKELLHIHVLEFGSLAQVLHNGFVSSEMLEPLHRS